MKKLISVLLAALLLLPSASAAYADGEEWKDLIEEERYEEALPLVQADAEAGNPKAINVLGRFYFYGWALEQDYDKAMELFLKASEMDYAPSMQMIGYMYDAGVGVEQDYAKALDWYQKAADLGEFYTMYNLALMYQYGKGVEQDYDKANEWLLKAAELGNEGAYTALGYNAMMGLGFERDDEKALEWYQKGAELGDPTAMFSLANMYDEGQGVEQDYGKAREWLEKAAELDYPWAMAALGAYYRIGRGVDRDEEKAQEWLQKAAELGVSIDDEAIREMMGEDGDDVILSDDASDFVLLSEAVPDAILEIRYYSTYNFVGDRIDGYEEPLAFLTKEAAVALKEVSDELAAKGYRLKIYDAYRPQRAVTNFMNWALDTEDTRMKEYFYPELEKDVLFPQGYIAEHSGHSRGSTVDLTLFDMKTEKEVDMGGTFDYFGELSHPDYTGITDEQYRNRMLLREAMLGHGFRPLAEEWWHFTLENEPYPDTYFTFPVNSDSLVTAEADAA